MFRLTVVASTMTELKKKLLEAANGIGAPEGQVTSSGRVTDLSDALKYASMTQPQQPSEDEVQEIDTDEPEVKSVITFAAPPSGGFPGIPMPPQRDDDPVETDDDEEATDVDSSTVDSRGIPWDARVHASSKTFNKDGTWRQRRGVDPKMLRKVEEDLKAQVATPAPTPVAPMPPMPTSVPPAPQPAVKVEVPTFQQPPSMPQQAPAAAQVPASYDNNIPTPQGARQAHTLETFKANLIMVFADLIRTGRINQDYVESLKNYFKVKEIWHVKDNEAQIREMYENFAAEGLITRMD